MTAIPLRPALVVGGATVHSTPRLAARLNELDEPLVVAADTGAVTALMLGFAPDVIVGDFDSIDPTALAELKSQGVPVEAYPRDKDATDGQLAVERALASGADELLLVGFLGGPRLDQQLANVLLLTKVTVPAVLVDGTNECRLLRGGEAWAWFAEPGELVSLLPVGSDAQGVSTQGLRWKLDRAALAFGDTRGVSNEPVADQVRVSCASGLLLVTRYFRE